MKPTKMQLQPSAFLWTPKGSVFLGELEHFDGFKPCLLGTFDTVRSELAELHKVEDGSSRLPKHCLSGRHVD
jgi:hypothetical protein